MALTNRHLTVSCFLGPAATKIHVAPGGSKAVFFSNNIELRQKAEAKGWDFFLLDVDRFPLDPDPRVSSLQAKYIKFQQFRCDFTQFKQFTRTTYVDHKVNLTPWHNVWMMSHIQPSSDLLMRFTPKQKDVVDEIRVASRQDRYKHSMPKTKRWVNEMCLHRGFSKTERVANTGILYIDNFERIMPLFDEVYNVMMELEQPECQIIWAMLSQGYHDCIDIIDWFDLAIQWKLPP